MNCNHTWKNTAFILLSNDRYDFKTGKYRIVVPVHYKDKDVFCPMFSTSSMIPFIKICIVSYSFIIHPIPCKTFPLLGSPPRRVLRACWCLFRYDQRPLGAADVCSRCGLRPPYAPPWPVGGCRRRCDGSGPRAVEGRQCI